MPQGKTILKLLWQPHHSIPRPCLRYGMSTPPSRPCSSPLQFHSPSHPPRTLTSTPHRTFSTTSPLLKKGNKEKRNAEPAPTSSSPGAADTPDANPFDTSALEASIQKAVDRLTDELSKLRAGGRFNPEVLETLRVHLVKGETASVKLGEVAQILPRGYRKVVLVVGEKEHLKPILTAVLSSPYSLTPAPLDPKNPTHVTVAIPSPTRAARLEALLTVTKSWEQAGAAVRAARAVMQKRLRAMSVAKTVRPDDLRRAEKGMEKIVEKGVREVKAVVDGAKKVLEEGW